MGSRVVIVDDHRLLRSALKSVLEKKDIEVAGEAEDGRTALKIIKKLSPDAAITDITMPGLNGIELTRQLHREAPKVRVMVLSMHLEARFVMDAFAAGACGYLLKESSSEEILAALNLVLSGRKYVGADIAGDVVDRAVAHWSSSKFEFPQISTREREVLQLVAEGKSTKEIAASLYVSIKTVETHRRQIMGRLNLPNIAHLTKYAVREGITSVQ
jgi:DNA-binding NarL/FixJ family response regulator